MTTPARNVNIVTSAPFYRTYPNGSQSLIGSNQAKWVYESRPPSGNAAKIGRFKKCAPFNHSGNQVGKLASKETFTHPAIPGQVYADAGCIWDGGLPTPQLPSINLRNACLSKALGRLKNQDFHLGNFVAEGKKTVGMVASRMSSIARMTQMYRKRFPRDWELVKAYEGTPLRHQWCNIPSLWLELQYGWKPLMSDVLGAINHLAKRSRFGAPFVTVKATEKDHVTSVTNHTSAIGSTSEALWRHEQEVQTFLIYVMQNPQLAELSSLGLINPAEIIWETMRYSFVVDWFLPVGSWLAGLTADVGYNFVTGGQSIKVKTTFQQSSIKSTSPSWNVLQVGPVGFTGELKSWQRICYSSSPFPGLYVKNPISLLHVTNAFALLYQAFR